MTAALTAKANQEEYVTCAVVACAAAARVSATAAVATHGANNNQRGAVFGNRIRNPFGLVCDDAPHARQQQNKIVLCVFED